MAAFARTELDLLGLARQDNQAAVQLFVDPRRQARSGGTSSCSTPRARRPTTRSSRASSSSTTPGRRSIPREIYVPTAADGRRRPRGVPRGPARRPGPPPASPQRGEKRELMALATRNADETLAREQARWLADQGKTLGALEELAEALGLPGPPARIECYDICELPGQRVGRRAWSCSRTASRAPASTAASGSGPSRARTTSPATRRSCAAGSAPPGRATRAARRSAAGRCPTSSSSTAASGQVSAAKGVLDELGLHDLPLAGLAKEREELFLPGRADPVLLPTTSPALYLVQRLRDEAHRFAITYHRDLRAQAHRPLEVRRPARRRAEAQARAAQGLRLDQARPRGAGRADRGGARASAARWRSGSRPTLEA